MKFALSSALLLASFAAVMAQGPSSSSSSAASSSASASSAAPPPASSSSSSSSGSMAAQAMATCTLVSGDPKAQPFGCVQGATTVTPPYDSASLLSYQIAKYTPGPKGSAVEEVAQQMAKTVTQLYPTLTVPYSSIVEQYASSLNRLAYGDGAMGPNVPAGMGMAAVVAVAVVAGGAFIL